MMRAGSPIRAVAIQIACGVLLAGAILVVAHFIAPNLLANLISPPKLLEVNPTVFKCSAHAGETVKTKFSVRNVTRENVNLLGIKTSCSCTTAETEFPVALRPGEAREININFTVGDPDVEGSFSRNAELFLDRDGAVPTLQLNAVVIPGAPPRKGAIQ